MQKDIFFKPSKQKLFAANIFRFIKLSSSYCVLRIRQVSEGRRHRAITLAEGGGQVGWRNDDDDENDTDDENDDDDEIENDNDDENDKEEGAQWRRSKKPNHKCDMA